jgi:thiamine biosynthesis lipoprotein
MLHTVTLARHAMATRFELVLHGPDPIALRSAGEEALQEIERLEAQLSLFRPASEIANINAAAARTPVRVSPAVFELLQQAKSLWRETQGAFDPTIAPLLRCWGFLGGKGSWPVETDLESVRSITGMQLVELSPADRTVRFTQAGVMLDLGAIGKGYAIQVAAELLRELGIDSALIHGGTSTVYALGHPPGADHWSVAIDGPPEAQPAPAAATQPTPPTASHQPADGSSPLPPGTVAIVPLRDEALSVSAVWGKCFERDGKRYGHVLDPRTGRPVQDALLAAVVLPSATETDAISTAMLVGGPAHFPAVTNLRPGMRGLLLTAPPTGVEIHSKEIKARL